MLPLVRAAAMSAFDKDRPLWEATIVDGLDDGRAAIVLEVHHSLTDGIGGIQIANEMVDFERDGTARGPLPENSSASAPASDLADSVGWYLSRAGEMVGRGVPWLVRSGLRSVTNPVASNVPGSPIPLYMAGAEVLRYYPFAPTVGSAVNITLMSHTSHCCIGINADSAAVPDLPVLVESLVEGFGDVLAVGGEGTRIETTLSATAASHP